MDAGGFRKGFLKIFSQFFRSPPPMRDRVAGVFILIIDVLSSEVPFDMIYYLGQNSYTLLKTYLYNSSSRISFSLQELNQDTHYMKNTAISQDS